MAALDPGPLDLRSFSLDSRSAGVVGMLYNGVSNRSRGWKSKASSETLGRCVSMRTTVKRWDGAARISSIWDNLEKDPELWYKNGNCFVYLYEQGQSHREHAFQVPFACLVSAKCGPLIEKFRNRSTSEEDAGQHGRVDLYIPAPPTASPSQALEYHIAIRNLFAWVCRRSMVGDHLGNALVALVHSMHEFRGDDVDNIQDLMGYLDEEGYLDMRKHPTHALAILHLAENLQHRGLYIDALAHCVGMNERLYKSPEYPRLSIASRKLIRRERADLDLRLSHAGAMLYDLLADDLSETHLGLPTGARAHLNRFRTYIHSFYTTKFGHFPPPPADPRCSTIFKPEVYCAMRTDFEGLYEYLVDERYTTADNIHPVAQGGICTLQSVHSFDLRHNFMPLPHPLSLLPTTLKGKESRSRLGLAWPTGANRTEGGGKVRHDQRLVVHASVMKATNSTKVHLLENELVLAYRKFEEDFILAPHKADRAERSHLSQSDARKVRWLLVYATYQTLRDCTEVPAEVTCQERVDYHLAVSAKGMLPWQVQVRDGVPSSPRSVSDGAIAMDTKLLVSEARRHSFNANRLAVPHVLPPESASQLSGSSLEIKPDVDYFALTHRTASQSKERSTLIEPAILGDSSRSKSLTRNLSLRRSISMFRTTSNQQPSTVEAVTPATPSRKLPQGPCMSVHHEIVIHGYGNGINSTSNFDKSSESVDALPDLKGSPRHPPYLEVITTPTANRSASTSSASSQGSVISSLSSGGKSDATSPTTIGESPRSSRHSSYKWENCDSVEAPADATWYCESPGIASPQIIDSPSLPIQRQSTRNSIRNMFSSDDVLATPSRAELSPLPRRNNSRFGNKSPAYKRWTLIDVVAPLRERNDDSDSEQDLEEALPRNRRQSRYRRKASAPVLADENKCDILSDSSDHEWEVAVHSAVDVSPPWSWEQFTDLGGFQPIPPSK